MRLPVNQLLAPLAVLILLSGCVGIGQGADAAIEPIARSGPAADYPVVIGAPFTINAMGYTPADALNYDAVGQAVITSDGGTAVSIAHKTLPLPSYAEVTALGHATQYGLTPSQMAVSRTICPACRAVIEQSGGQLTGPTTAIWPR